MSNPDGVLAAIDACLEDALSEDAMRWAPDEPDPTASGETPFAAWARFIEYALAPRFELAGWQRHMLPGATCTTSNAPTIRSVVDLAASNQGIVQATRSFADAFAKTLEPLRGIQAALHRQANRNDRKHVRRCSICNPRGFPKGMSIDRSRYRQRRRNRR
ncbi:hypothetical protein ACFWYW_59210 [Nonomuraea sp. NPDC059023]|uniref:hypothetical protein n=1 Tax=unclassified Nonomuraea TaxID=2593643 RepID=UPI0036A46998